MNAFARLFAGIDATTSTNEKVAAMAAYFRQAAAAEAAWAVFFLSGRRFKRLLPSRAIADWAASAAGAPDWLLGECYAAVGDGAETAALLFDALPYAAGTPLPLNEWVEARILPLRAMPASAQRLAMLDWLQTLTRWERFTLLKLVTGELRVGVSQTLVVRALAEVSGAPVSSVAARLAGEWTPSASWYQALVSTTDGGEAPSRPYPFCLASPLVEAGAAPDLQALLGDRGEWQVEWKWDGIRAQLIVRQGEVFLWSRGDELITDRFPEPCAAARGVPDGTVLDGELLAFQNDRPLPFSALQRRIGRVRQVGRAAGRIPVVFMAFDVLEHRGADVRGRMLGERRSLLEQLVAEAAGRLPDGGAWPGQAGLPFGDADDRPPGGALRVSPLIGDESWDAIGAARQRSRSLGVEGLLIKRLESAYVSGRKRGDWWKWKIEPYTVDAVLIYAQPGSGKRASLLTDYTFGLWDGEELVPVAKAYSGLSNDEIRELDAWIRRHTVTRFGPVRHVDPVQVFELGFEAIARSTRHRSGVAVRFPRMLRWRKDKPARDADTLAALAALLGST